MHFAVTAAGPNPAPRLPVDNPIGVFDSGIGGLSVLRHIRRRLPSEHLLYFADSGFAPYGDKSEIAIVARSLAIAEFLLLQGAKALVVACNTATAAAITALRAQYPGLALVGVEPGLKPAAALSKNGRIGVLATGRTLCSNKFIQLQEQISAETGAIFLLQACNGLADRIELGELDSAATINLVRSYVAPLIEQHADTLVLGCTHYPFVQTAIANVAAGSTPGPVAIIDTGDAVARQLECLLGRHGLLRSATGPGTLDAFSSGSKTALESAFMHLLHLQPSVIEVPPAPESVSRYPIACDLVCQHGPKFV